MMKSDIYSKNQKILPSTIAKGAFLVQLFAIKFLYDKKTYILILVSLLPLLTIGNLRTATPDDYVRLVGPNSIFTFLIMPLISLILGVSAIAEEKENKTISQLLARPVKREEIVLSKWITIIVIGLIITCIDSVIIYSGLTILVPNSNEMLGALSVLFGSWLYLGLWYIVYATIFLFLGIFIDKNALGWGLGVAYFEAFFGQFIFGLAQGGNSPYSITNHINYVATEYFLPDYFSFTITNFEPINSLIVCAGLIIVFLLISLFTMRRKDFP